MADETIPITGTDGKEHRVPAELIDRHFHGSDGRMVSDEEWDEMKRREAAPINFNSDDFRVEEPS